MRYGMLMVPIEGLYSFIYEQDANEPNQLQKGRGGPHYRISMCLWWKTPIGVRARLNIIIGRMVRSG